MFVWLKNGKGCGFGLCASEDASTTSVPVAEELYHKLLVNPSRAADARVPLIGEHAGKVVLVEVVHLTRPSIVQVQYAVDLDNADIRIVVSSRALEVYTELEFSNVYFTAGIHLLEPLVTLPLVNGYTRLDEKTSSIVYQAHQFYLSGADLNWSASIEFQFQPMP